MAELTQQEILQPSLLDRLTDDEPTQKMESREKRVLSLRQLRESVLRDLAWLMNTTDFNSAESLKDFPEVANSTINYGVPELTGHTLLSLDKFELERMVKRAILRFEPRILEDTLGVELKVDDDLMSKQAMTFDIKGELWAQPVPMKVYLKTELDLEIGNVKIQDLS